MGRCTKFTTRKNYYLKVIGGDLSSSASNGPEYDDINENFKPIHPLYNQDFDHFDSVTDYELKFFITEGVNP